MVHEGIFASSDQIITKAGANYDTAITEARINTLCLEAESYINIVSEHNWTTGYAALNTAVKNILSMAESDLVAIYMINYNMLNYTSRTEAQTMLDVLTDRLRIAMDLLKNQDKVAYMLSI